MKAGSRVTKNKALLPFHKSEQQMSTNNIDSLLETGKFKIMGLILEFQEENEAHQHELLLRRTHLFFFFISDTQYKKCSFYLLI